MPMTPEEARAILEAFNIGPPKQDREKAFLWWHVQAAIMKGPRAAELADLHARIVEAQQSSPQKDATDAMHKRAAILEELLNDAKRELREKGLPPWATEPTN